MPSTQRAGGALIAQLCHGLTGEVSARSGGSRVARNAATRCKDSLPCGRGQRRITGGLTSPERLLGRGTELPRTTHADGAETSWTLHFYPDIVRPGYERFPQSPSSRFLEVLSSGDRTKNPSGSGGFPFDKASANVGKQIVDYKTVRIGEAILQVLRVK